MVSIKIEKRLKRKKRVRAKIFGTAKVPRLSVFRSNKHIYAQIIDDDKGRTLVSASDLELTAKQSKGKKKTNSKEGVLLPQGSKSDLAFLVGQLLAKKSLKKGINKVVFDRGGFKYHGRIKALSEGARKGGLKF